MSDNGDQRDVEAECAYLAEGLYHEAQADGVPYDEDLEPFTKELPKLDYHRS